VAVQPLPGSKVIANARTAMFSIAGRIVSDNIRAFEEEKSESGKNLVSVLIKANLDSNVPESQRLTHIEVVSRTCFSLFLRKVLYPNSSHPARDSRFPGCWARNNLGCNGVGDACPLPQSFGSDKTSAGAVHPIDR
jgi:hypothetical protein